MLTPYTNHSNQRVSPSLQELTAPNFMSISEFYELPAIFLEFSASLINSLLLK